ncbi:MAG: aldehyde dehydrogenase, partial [Planctomycetes bacterium]|nr:aldehyde dehydrogenase [Planctomycetota bacterium]
MTNEPIRIPVLRAGKPYESLEQSEVKDLRTGAVLAVVDQANAGIVRRDLKKQDEHFAALRAIPIAERLRLCKRAGELFLR